MIRTKTSAKEAKHTDKKAVRDHKLSNTRKKRSTVGKADSSVDSETDKENNVPASLLKKKLTAPKSHESNEKKVRAEVITKSLDSGSKHKKKYLIKTKSPVKEAEIDDSEEEKSDKPV